MDAFHAYVDAHTATWVDRLREAVAVDSVSSDPARRPKCIRMMELARDHIVRLGGTAELNPIGEQTFPSGETVPLPPIVTGCYPAVADPAKKTVLVYGHLDVQPASMADAGWEFDPFTLTEKDGKLFGRGATDDKGPVLAWLWAIESYKAVGLELPVNVKFVLEGMEESGSEGFDDFVLHGRPEFFKGVDATCISDNYYLGPRKPCVTYGLRGLCYFMASIKCARADMHSGVYGGSVREAMVDLVKLLATLNTPDGGIAVPGIMEHVRPFTEEEKATYASIDFDPAEFAKQVGVPKALRFSDKESILSHRWRFPTLSIHGVEGAWAGSGAKTVIPHTVVGKFSLRLVPDQDPADIEAKVRAHLASEFAKLGSPNTLDVHMDHGARAWMSSVDSPNYVAARRAVKAVHDVEPDLTREGGSIPITLVLEQATGNSVLLLPIGGSDDGAHSAPEKINVSNYVSGIKVLGQYLAELAKA